MADTFTITEQRPVTDAVPGGTFQPAMEISFTTKPHNVPGVVRVPMSQYSPENVAQVVGAQAAQIEAVQSL